MSINENIRTYRKQRKLTQEELAEAMAVSCAAVSKWENGQCAPDLATLAALADYFEVSVDALLGHQVKADRLDALLTEVDQLTKAHEIEKAATLVEELLRNYPNEANVVDRCAEIYYRLFMHTQSVPYMEKCIRQTQRLFTLKKGEPEADRLDRLSYLANQYELIGQWEKAKEYYEKGNVGGSEDAGIARCLMGLGRPQEALTTISETIVKRFFDLEQHVSALAYIWEELGEKEKSLKAMEWISDGMEKLHYAPAIRQMFLSQIANLREKMGDHEGAMEAVRKLEQITVEPKDLQSVRTGASFLKVNKPRRLLLSSNYQDVIAETADRIKKRG